MEIKITKKSIIINPAPKKDKKNGLKLYFWRDEMPEEPTLPILTTDLVKGKSTYTLPNIKNFRYSIKSIKF